MIEDNTQENSREPTDAAREPVTVLVVDDDPQLTSYLDEVLSEEGYHVATCQDATEAMRIVLDERPRVVVSDIEMPGLRGTDLLAEIRERAPETLVILITAFGSIDLAVRCVRDGAADFLAKPFTDEMLVLAIERALDGQRTSHELRDLQASLGPDPPSGIVARSPSMRALTELALRAARSRSTVLLTGESGVGKGHLAQYIHENSPRASGPFQAVNCGALPPSLVEAELFGVHKGAYTDARVSRPGLIRQSSGGTLFLDEVGEMPLDVQVKLLQFLESDTVRPVGGSYDEPVDIRVIAATNRPLEEALEERRFRPDLYYRLNVIRIEIPPLRERREDIEPLFARFLARACRRADRDVTGLTHAARSWILDHDWPGNVRELSNVVERAVALCDGSKIDVHDLAPMRAHGATPAPSATPSIGELPATMSLSEIEKIHILRVLSAVSGNKSAAARVLGIDRRTLYRKLEELERDG